MPRKPPPSLGDNLKGMWRSMRNGTGMSMGATFREIMNARNERLMEEGYFERVEAERRRKEAAKRLEKQANAWAKKFRDGRSVDIKAVYNVDEGYTDFYYSGQGEDPDGPGHGHIRVWEDGREQVVREPYRPGQPYAKREATLLDDNTPDKRI